MTKRITALLLALSMAFALCACVGDFQPFEKEYYSESDYQPPQSGEIASAGISVATYARLKSILAQMVSEGETQGRINFDTDYEGDVAADLASACWELRTQNAICAYCVENISYELSKIVTSYEADVLISYTDSGVGVDEIIRRQYFIGIEDVIYDALEKGEERIALYISNCTRNAQQLTELCEDVYYDYPLIAPTMPTIEVNTYGSNGLQRLFEVNIDYRVDSETMKRYREDMEKLTLWESEPQGSAAELALFACEYICDNCADSVDGHLDSAYGALVLHESGSEGLALAYSELCRRLGIQCQLVRGKLDWEEHCWNIVRIDGESYHVDVSECMTDGIEAGFLLDDESIWGRYRWDTASYPECAGTLSYNDIVAVG